MRVPWQVTIAVLIVVGSSAALMGAAPPTSVTNVLLVHGAFADGSSWSKVIPLLLNRGLKITAVGIPLTSFADDVAATRRAIATQDGPTILVGHSYGGVVITEAGNDPKVAGLVYVAAFAPDAGQSIGEISKDYAKPAGLDELRPQPDGFLLLSPKGVQEDFAQDLTPSEKALLIAVQPQTVGAIFEAKPTAAAWRSKPSWYVVSSNDRMIAPEQEKAMAARIKAKTTVLPASHVSMLSQPAAVAKVIEEAAAGIRN
jgi:pimeloyl-ACP methyl ester carboxylesterase